MCGMLASDQTEQYSIRPHSVLWDQHFIENVSYSRLKLSILLELNKCTNAQHRLTMRSLVVTLKINTV